MLARVLGVIAVFVVSLAAQAAERPESGRYHALVIGNNAYEHLKDLERAVSDAAAVARFLRLENGFRVTLKLNATRAEILSEINRLRSALTEKDLLLIHYAGHGELDQASATSYRLPLDAAPEDDTNWIANEALTRHFNRYSPDDSSSRAQWLGQQAGSETKNRFPGRMARDRAA